MRTSTRKSAGRLIFSFTTVRCQRLLTQPRAQISISVSPTLGRHVDLVLKVHWEDAITLARCVSYNNTDIMVDGIAFDKESMN